MSWKNVLVVGAGGVGSLVAELLNDQGLHVRTLDQKHNPSLPSKVEQLLGDASSEISLAEYTEGMDAVISCLPYHLTTVVATAAHKAGIHYFDLTEDVASTETIREFAKSSTAAMVPQCGLAPGAVGIIAAHLAKQFDSGSLRNIKMRVGALPQNPIGQLGYAGNWSLAGLVHEYIAPCDAIVDGAHQKVPALRNAEVIRINGIEYEAFSTSGGLGTMTETYAGKVNTLNYKSIRYPGHLDAMKLLLEELRFKEEPDALVQRLHYALPPDDLDRVLIHCSVQGEIKGRFQTKEIVCDFPPLEILRRHCTAIAWTTACSAVAVMDLVRYGKLPQKGFVKQEDISLKDFVNTKTGRNYALNNPQLREFLA